MKKDRRLNPRKKPAQARSRVTVDAILQAAAQVFVEEGYAATTTNAVAERAGVSIGSLYQYFPGKEAILYGLMERHVRDAYEFIVKETEEVEHEKEVTSGLIRRLVEHMIDLHRKNPELHRVLFEEVRFLHFRDDYQTNEELAARRLRDLLNRTPDCRKPNRETAVSLLVQTLEASTHRFVLYGYGNVGEAEFVDELTDMLSRYILDI